MPAQNPSALLMVRPVAFGYNSEAALTNAFQSEDADDPQDIVQRAIKEFDTMVDLLQAHNIIVHVVEDTDHPKKPDAVFPNNWISFHEDGRVILYPMQPVSRRVERRLDIIEWIRKSYLISEVLDESTFEQQKKFLEGTGSLVFDHANRLTYACRSPRTNEELVKRICSLIGYEPVVFDAVDENGYAIYHTNVMLCIGSKFVVICLDSVHAENDQDLVLDHFARTGHKVVAISYEQMRAFAGNMIEVLDRDDNPYVLMSKTAFDSLVPGQIDAISRHAEPLPIAVPTIEHYGGGSVRCMVAGIHLKKK
jgi:hypothetical protein